MPIDIRFIEVGRWGAGTGEESLIFSVNGKRFGAIWHNKSDPAADWDSLHDYFHKNPPNPQC